MKVRFLQAHEDFKVGDEAELPYALAFDLWERSIVERLPVAEKVEAQTIAPPKPELKRKGEK